MMYIGKIKPRKSRELNTLITIIVMSTLAFLAILINGKYSSKIDVNGVVVRKDITKIHTGESGAIEEIFFKDGDYVNKGDALFKISNSSSSYSNLIDDSSLYKKIDSVNKLMKDELEDYLEQIEIIRYESERKLNLVDIISNEIKLLRTNVEILKKDLLIIENKESRFLHLISKNMMSKDNHDSILLEKQSKNKDINLINIEISSRVKEKLKLELEIKNSKLKLVELDKNHRKEMDQLSDRLDNYKLKDSYYIRSTSTGYINHIDSYQNKSVSEGDVLATVKEISNNKVYIQLFSDSESLSYAKFNNDVTLRIEAFPYESYGVLKGEIIGISPTKITNPSGDRYFSIIVKIDDSFGSIKKDWLLDGMKVVGTYSGKEMSLLEWLFLPVVKGIKRNPEYWG